MAEMDQDEKNPNATSLKINWSSSNLAGNLLLNTAVPSTVGHSYSQQTVLEHGRQFSKKLLPSRLRLRTQASTKCSPLGSDYLAEKKLRDAVHKSNTNTLFELINQGVNVCGADSKRRTALHFAAAQGMEWNGNTPLHLTACINQPKIVTLLLQAGSDAADFSGKTPLDLAYSRLRVLQGDLNIKEKPSGYCEEVKQVIEMIKAYMSRLGNTKAEETIF